MIQYSRRVAFISSMGLGLLQQTCNWICCFLNADLIFWLEREILKLLIAFCWVVVGILMMAFV